MKKHLRQNLRNVLSEIPPEQVHDHSVEACHLLVQQPEYQEADILMVFLPLPGDIDTTPLCLKAWQDHKRVLAPRVSWEQRRMIPIEIRSLTHDLTVTDLGFREPTGGVPIPSSLIDLVIVPGLGFDAFGNRLGRGRGFYDRFLATPDFSGCACALAFEEQFVDQLPTGPLDHAVNMAVTHQQVRRFGV